MIKKDLEDINKLKQSAFYETSKYTYMYPQTQSILDSIRNFEIEPKTDRQSVGEFEAISPLTLQKDDFNHFAQRPAGSYNCTEYLNLHICFSSPATSTRPA